jgi:type IV secretory pathway TrbF-like protein
MMQIQLLVETSMKEFQMQWNQNRLNQVNTAKARYWLALVGLRQIRQVIQNLLPDE